MTKKSFDLCIDNDILGAKLVGSSGSIVILFEERPDFLINYESSLKKENYGFNCIELQIDKIIKLKVGCHKN